MSNSDKITLSDTKDWDEWYENMSFIIHLHDFECYMTLNEDPAIADVFGSSIAKERKVMDSDGLSTRLNYNVFFGSPEESIAPGIPPNPRMARYVESLIIRWIMKVCRCLQYPSISRKTVEDQTTTIARSILSSNVGIHPSQTLERTLHQVALHTTSLKYIAKMMVNLCDSMPPTNGRTCINPTHLCIKDGHHAFIYDLTGFTSSLHEQRHFVDRLAEYCHGNAVKIVDAWSGVIDIDLGDLIKEYNTLNNQGQYSQKQACGKDIPMLLHCTAGFLGVYGNIANATFLHGITILQLYDDDELLNVAGDDGIGDSGDDEEVFTLLRYLGTLEMLKSFSTHEEGYPLEMTDITAGQSTTPRNFDLIAHPPLSTSYTTRMRSILGTQSFPQ
ncbi:hypothetical protein FQN52_003466 [Onygenales sp. PD_12]|nr:hypothetical protein FQN52_003466 [Onygenales sp. PD_12]